jgi:hypothetical protein
MSDESERWAEFLETRKDLLRVVKAQTPSGTWFVGLVLDGYYTMDSGEMSVEGMDEHFAERMGLPAGFPSRQEPSTRRTS